MDYRTVPETSVAQGLDHCNGCGACCRFSPCLLLPKDVRKLCDGLGISRAELATKLRVETNGAGLWRVRMNNPCAFLSADNRCQVHDFKPTGGRDFKCWTENRQTYFWRESDLRLIGFRTESH